MEDVIFGGTSSRKALGFAQVVLTLDNTDGSLDGHGDIVTVSRRYYRSGESEYKIDGESVRRKDIHELFMDTGLGADGYSMVGQGKIDSIISAKNEDRRELFEEAAGISRFRHKRRDAERRLEQAQACSSSRPSGSTYATCYASTSRRPTMWLSMRLWSTGCASPSS